MGKLVLKTEFQKSCVLSVYCLLAQTFPSPKVRVSILCVIKSISKDPKDDLERKLYHKRASTAKENLFNILSQKDIKIALKDNNV